MKTSNNTFVIILFTLFALLVLFSSLQTVSNTQKAVDNATKILNSVTLIPTPTPTYIVIPTPTAIPPYHPGFRVNGGGEGGDD